ncbi:MAG: hypothetical protein IJK61_07815 [Bacteroidetes bacterium]|nr:hypothetical protein [Bacteroidota bacterium]
MKKEKKHIKVILSRKGFDSSNGGFPSLILPEKDKDGFRKMISLPIPCCSKCCNYEKCKSYKYSNDTRLYNMMSNLYNGKGKKRNTIKIKKNNKIVDEILLSEATHCHLDPCLGNYSIKELEKVGIFGQHGRAATELKDVRKDDIFIFFGLFNDVAVKDDKYIIKNKENGGRHVMFGYLQAGKIIDNNKYYIEYEKHPHFCCCKIKNNNIIYIARKRLKIDSKELDVAGYGMFKYDSKLDLTQQKPDKTYWNSTRWSCDNLPTCLKDLIVPRLKYECKDNYFQSAPMGQEFVIEDNKEVEKWAIELIKKHSVNRIK